MYNIYFLLVSYVNKAKLLQRKRKKKGHITQPRQSSMFKMQIQKLKSFKMFTSSQLFTFSIFGLHNLYHMSMSTHHILSNPFYFWITSFSL